MRGGGGSGLVRGGCAGFSLIGVLVAVGLTVWLGSMAFDGSKGGTDRSVLHGATTTAPPLPDLAITVTPATGLDAAGGVTVTSTAFAVGTEVEVSTCVNGLGTFAADTCDPESTTTATVGADGTLEGVYAVRRVVTIDGTPFDCASAPKQCQVQVVAADDPAQAGRADVSFRSDLGTPPMPGLDTGG